MPKKVFRFVLKIKDCEKVFDESLGPGVLVEQDAEYNLPKDYSEVQLAAELVYQQQEFLERYVEVKMVEIE